MLSGVISGYLMALSGWLYNDVCMYSGPVFNNLYS